MISVCMATFNGERFLQAQISSILTQLADGDELVICDDSSTDGTKDLLRSMNDFRIRLLCGNGFRSPQMNFAFALSQGRGDVLVLADQDDVWLPGRLETGLQKLREMELRYGTTTPLLVHTDLKVVDEELQPIADSLWRYQKSDPVAGIFLNRLLSQNPVTGCTVMINSALRDLALPIPQGAVMHDWWLALVASAFGAVGHVSRPTVLYRQHQENDTGARRWGVRYALGQLGGQHAVMSRLYRQAGAFLERYRNCLNPAQTELLEAFATMEQAGALEKRRRIMKYRFFYTGLIRNIGRLLLG